MLVDAPRWTRRALFCALAVCFQVAALAAAASGTARAQAGFDDDRVMLQGFYWESYRHGHPAAASASRFASRPATRGERAPAQPS